MSVFKGLIDVHSTDVSGGTEKGTNTSIKIARLPVEMRTEHLPNTNLLYVSFCYFPRKVETEDSEPHATVVSYDITNSEFAIIRSVFARVTILMIILPRSVIANCHVELYIFTFYDE
jgi:hypothetical protein